MTEMAFSTKQRNEDTYEEKIIQLDESQRAAVESEEENVVITASAGSGKTSTLITAIVGYRYNNLNDRICAITYTRAARAEMEARLQEMGVFDVEVTTIHVWARNLLNEYALKYDFKVKVLEESDIKAILETLWARYRSSHRYAKMNIGVLYSFITGNKTMDVSDNYKRTLKALEEMYIEYKDDNRLYDFTDYPKYLYDVMEYYGETVKNIDALFVDEFQDVDPIQYELFCKVLTKKKFYIGDAWQSIFQFRGADGEVFKKLQNFKLYKLKYNYRSYQIIIDYATTVYEEAMKAIEWGDTWIGQTVSANESKIICAKGKAHGSVLVVNPSGEIYSLQEDRKEDFYHPEKLKEILEKMLNTNPMILCRTNKQVKAIQDLGYTNVSTIHQAKGLEYDNVVVIDYVLQSEEDIKIAYVALTRAKNNMMVIPFNLFSSYANNKKFIF